MDFNLALTGPVFGSLPCPTNTFLSFPFPCVALRQGPGVNSTCSLFGAASPRLGPCAASLVIFKPGHLHLGFTISDDLYHFERIHERTMHLHAERGRPPFGQTHPTAPSCTKPKGNWGSVPPSVFLCQIARHDLIIAGKTAHATRHVRRLPGEMNFTNY